MLLEANRLSKIFGGIRVLDEVSISIKEQSITTVIGPNGSVISGFVRQDGGTVHYRTQCLDQIGAAERAVKGLGRLWQDVRLFRNMTVLDNLLVAVKHHPGDRLMSSFFSRGVMNAKERHARESAMGTLEMLGLTQDAARFASNLSYGQQKLVAIGRLLLNEADLLLIDEPLSGLNGAMITKVLDLMRTLIGRGKTILMIEHNVEKALEIADQVYVMEDGRVEMSGSPSDVQASSILQEVYLGV